MNRRDSLKAIGLGTLSTSLFLGGCKPGDKKVETAADAKTAAVPGRQPYEVERENKLLAEKYFDEHEMATITMLADIIIPKDAHSGSASDAKVPEFIEFIVKDIPSHKLPMRGGLKWLDIQCLNRYGNTFIKCNSTQKTQILDEIAYPAKAKPEMAQGVAFFNRLRDLTASGFWSSEMGTKDIGYAGNTPNKWQGVPADVLKQYGMENVKV
ncbi:gluconate 2-dehydrogenase subunit 3 family protein [Mucilaginibacter sp. RB4R14]|uniref:gluconate 2-dehydrogenase subunit 3 family protein n=1 Tax=Mucilaginibacter aurantiaciroseus TaxID=2949308 RepID=UPI0020916369|nr:gluconate 2-dehydrogenase subunit 3 family protein [Mucilaginibacter aurantiaciroseus]MCO5936944.1 gluconate 2-dehydrogenase subunit 3 family protein [Mucilaginibacter aurantiaciroseus]